VGLGGLHCAYAGAFNIEELFMNKDEILKLALEALEGNTTNPVIDPDQAAIEDQAITAIQQALAADVQEPVRGWWAHTSPITGSTDVQDWQLTEGDKERGWIEREIYTTPPAQPAVPDAMTSADIQEHIEYVAGWNDCRQAMLEMMK
jgi:hypothetical protein